MNTQKLYGASHEQGGIPIEAEGGERIFSVKDTNKMENLAQGNKFKQLGEFIKKAMSIQDSRPLDYKGMASMGAKIFDGVNNELPFNLSEKEHDILNQYAAYNNTITPGILNTNIAKTIMARTGANTAKALAPPVDYQSAYQNAVKAGVKFPAAVEAQWQLESARGKKTAAKNNFFGIKYDQGAVSRLSKLGYNIGKGPKVKDKQTGSWDHYMEFDDPSAAFAAYQGFIETNPRYKKALASSTADEYIKQIKAAGYAQDPNYVNKLMGIIPTSVKNDQSAMGVNTGYVPSNFSTQAGTQPATQPTTSSTSQANQPYSFQNAPTQSGGITGVMQQPQGVTQQSSGALEIDREKQEKRDQLNSYKNNVKNQERLIKEKQEHNKVLEEEIKSNQGKWKTKWISSPAMIGKEEYKKRKAYNANNQKEKEKLKQQIKQNEATINQALKDRDTQVNKIHTEYYKPEIDALTAHLNSASTDDYDYHGTKLNREQIKQKIKDLGNYKEVQIKARERDGILSDMVFLSDDKDFIAAGEEMSLDPAAPTDSGQVPTGVLGTGQAPTNITTPAVPTTSSVFTGTQPQDDANKRREELKKKIGDYDPDTNITGEATTTYEDLFSDKRTNLDKAKDFLLNNALNIAEVIGGVAGASKTLPRFMISEQLINQAQEINERAQTGLTSEEKSSMIRDAVEKEQTAYNVLGGSGLSSGQMLAIAPQLQRQTQDQKLKIDILDEQVREKYEDKSTNMEKYLSDLQYKTQFMPDYQETMQDKNAAVMTAQAGLQGIQENIMFNRQYGEGTPYAALQKATTQNIVEDIRSKEMAQSKATKEAEYLDMLDTQRGKALQGIGGLTDQEILQLDPNDIQSIIKQFNP